MMISIEMFFKRYWYIDAFNLVRFYTVETITGHKLSLIAEHYICVEHFGYLSASHLTLNHSLYVLDDTTNSVKTTRIQRIKFEEKEGAYNPVTLSGTLLVNGILASSYSNIFSWSHETIHYIGIPFRCWHYLAGYLGIYPAYSTINNDLHWTAKALLSFGQSSHFIYSILKVISIIIMIHFISIIYNLIIRNFKQSTNSTHWTNIYIYFFLWRRYIEW